MALCGCFARLVGPDAERVEALMGLSALGQGEKWRERVDYRERTIARAIEGLGQAEGLTLTMRSQEIPGTPRSSQELHRGVWPGGPDLEMDGVVRQAEDLAGDVGGVPARQQAFALARRLKRYGQGQPEEFQGAVRAFCERAGQPYREFWLWFVDGWGRVRFAEGEGDFVWAEKMAREHPLLCLPELGEDFVLVGSLAYYLSLRTAPAPFYLPVVKVGQVMEMSAQMGSIVVRQLVQRGVITPTDGSYAYAQGKARAKEYRFTWAVPASPLPEAA